MFWITYIYKYDVCSCSHMLFAKPMIHIVHIFCSLYMKWRPWIACKGDTEALWCVSSGWWNRQLSANQSPWHVIDSQAVQLFSEVSGFECLYWKWHFLFWVHLKLKYNVHLHTVKSCLIEGFEFKGFPLSFNDVGVCHSAMFVYVCTTVLIG